MRARLVQCLCPARHCILAMAFADDSIADADAIDMMRQSIEIGCDPGKHPEEFKTMRERAPHLGPHGIDPWCGICGAQRNTWIYEIGRLFEGRWVDVLEDLRQAENDQRRTAEILKALGLSYDEARRIARSRDAGKN